MPEQLIFEFPRVTAFGRDDFFRSEVNEQAVQTIETWTDWPSARMILNGASGSGKSHLARIWADDAGAQIIRAAEITAQSAGEFGSIPLCVEDAHALRGDRAAQEGMFHLYNLLGSEGQALLITGQGRPNDWADCLPDLNSRLNSVSVVTLGAPDDALLFAVLLKHAEDRQLVMSERVINYVLPRLERSYDFVADVVSALDTQALRDTKKITVPMARAVLDKIQTQRDDTA